MDRTERLRQALAIEAASFKAGRDKFDALQPGCRVRNRDNKTAVFIKHAGPMTAQILVDGDSIFSNVGVEGLTVLPDEMTMADPAKRAKPPSWKSVVDAAVKRNYPIMLKADEFYREQMRQPQEEK